MTILFVYPSTILYNSVFEFSKFFYFQNCYLDKLKYIKSDKIYFFFFMQEKAMFY